MGFSFGTGPSRLLNIAPNGNGHFTDGHSQIRASAHPKAFSAFPKVWSANVEAKHGDNVFGAQADPKSIKVENIQKGPAWDGN